MLSARLFWCCRVFRLDVGCVTTHWHWSAKAQRHQGRCELTFFWGATTVIWWIVFVLLCLSPWRGLCHNTLTQVSKKHQFWAVTTQRHPHRLQGWMFGCHYTLTPTKTPRLGVGLSQHIDTHKNTKVGLSQHSDTHTDFKVGCWAVTTHWHPQKHQGWAVTTHLTPTKTPRLDVWLSLHTDTHKNTKVGCWAVTTHWHPQKHQALAVTTHW